MKTFRHACVVIWLLIVLTGCGETRTSAITETIFTPSLTATPLPPTQRPAPTLTSISTLSPAQYFEQNSHTFRVAYEDFDNHELCASLGDGTNKICIPSNGYYGLNSGAWSPDGNRLMIMDNNIGLSIWDLSGVTTQYIAVSGIVYTSPAWSPDGEFIAYETTELQRGVGQIYGMDIFVSNLDKTIQHNITRYLPAKSHSRNPDWSPDSSKIAFDSMIHDWNNPTDTEIYIVGPDGKEPRALTSNLADDIHPIWSPSGNSIAFLSDREGAFDLYVMNADGANATRMARLGLEYAEAYNSGDYFWLPDEKSILFGNKLIELATGKITQLQFDFSTTEATWLMRPTSVALSPIPTPHCAVGWTRLAIGTVVTVSQGDPNRVRSAPSKSAEVTGQLYPGTVSKIIEGPICADGLVYWKVENSTIPGGSGWTAEGDGKDYWLEPYQP